MGNSKERQGALRRLRAFQFSARTEIGAFRARIDEEFSEPFLPNRVDLEERSFGDVPCDVLRPEMYAKNRLMLYVHGGSFVAGSRRSYRPFVASLAHACSCVAVLPEFRLAPAFPFPFSVNDVQGVFRSLLGEMRDDFSEGGSPELILCADTSGASIALGFLLNLKPKFRSLFSRIVLFSPWLDVSDDGGALKSRRGADEVFTSEGVRLSAENYATSDRRSDPLVSPLLAEKERLESFPPILVQMGEKELFMDDAERLEALCASANVGCTLDVWKGMMPMFQMADDFLPESHLAVERLGAAVKARGGR